MRWPNTRWGMLTFILDDEKNLLFFVDVYFKVSKVFLSIFREEFYHFFSKITHLTSCLILILSSNVILIKLLILLHLESKCKHDYHAINVQLILWLIMNITLCQSHVLNYATIYKLVFLHIMVFVKMIFKSWFLSINWVRESKEKDRDYGVNGVVNTICEVNLRPNSQHHSLTAWRTLKRHRKLKFNSNCGCQINVSYVWYALMNSSNKNAMHVETMCKLI